MAFKTLNQYNAEKNKGFFTLQNDGDYADVIFMYRGIEDVMIADVHYIKSAEYSGYVHCCGDGCPACEKGIRVQNKIFIPLYNISDNEIQYFDRTTFFEPQLMSDVFNKYPDPSACVFRIIRHGEARSRETRYEIRAVSRNTVATYDEILQKLNTSMPKDYEQILREYPAFKLSEMLMNVNDTPHTSNLGEYVATPRVAVPTAPSQPIDASMPPVTTVIDAPVSSVTDSASEDAAGDSSEELDGDVLF